MYCGKYCGQEKDIFLAKHFKIVQGRSFIQINRTSNGFMVIIFIRVDE